ncbi:hypothetical protein EV668_1067 [Enterovirga rhinocerotis]|uniref:Uncharacterized protein n=1 Tax=Enterovirga rhinocerotis TaxID=1339210 RepID=A0A4R7C5F2_9HYPH|nr:hypothetical protein EV668_1067 [Enterovirga rhinocerotis]
MRSPALFGASVMIVSYVLIFALVAFLPGPF